MRACIRFQMAALIGEKGQSADSEEELHHEKQKEEVFNHTKKRTSQKGPGRC